MRYERAQQQSANLGSGRGSQAATSVIASNFVSLSNRLQSFRKQAFQAAGEQAASQAVSDAANDDFKQKPFHKESVRTVYGKAYNNSRSASFMTNGEQELNNKANELSLTYKHDPIQFRKAYQAYLDGDITQLAPTPEIKAALLISGKKLQNSAYGKLAVAKDAEETQLQQQEWVNGVDLGIQQVINMNANGDYKTAKLIEQNMLEYTQTLVDEGKLSPVVALRAEKQVTFSIDKGTREQHLKDLIESGDMEAARTFVHTGSIDTSEQYTQDQAYELEASLTKIYTGAVKTQDAVIKKNNTNANKKIKEVIKKKKQGVTDQDEIQISDDEISAADPLLQAQLLIQKKTDKFMLQFQGLSQRQKEALLSAKKQDLEYSSLDVSIQKSIEDNIKSTGNGYKNDPLEQGAVEGSYDRTESIMPGMDTVIIADLLRERSFHRDINVENAGSTADQILRPEELKAWTDVLDDGSTEDQLGLLGFISQQDGDISKTIFNQLSKKGGATYATVGSLVKNGNQRAAILILNGQKADVKIKDADTEVNGKLASIIGNQNIEVFNQYKKNTEFFAKGRMAESGSETSGTDRLESVYGKIESYNSKKIFLPPNTNKDQFDSFLSEYVVEGDEELTEEIQGLAGMWASGDIQLHYDEEGKYLLFNPNTGKYIKRDKDNFLEIEYNADR